MDDLNYYPPPKAPIAAAITAALVTSAALFFGLRALDHRGAFGKPGGGTSRGAVDVPSLVGLRVDQAREELRTADLLLVLTEERETREHPPGTIASQTPLARSQVFRGAPIQAVLAVAPKRQAEAPEPAAAEVPDPHKAPVPPAGAHNPAVAARAAAPVAPAAPAAAPVAAPAAAPVPVPAAQAESPAKKSATDERAIPKVIGMRPRPARELLQQQGFKVGKVRYTSNDDRAAGVVLEQKPAAGTPAVPGAVIDLVVNAD